MFAGRLALGNGDSAQLTYRLTTLATTPPPPPPPGPGPSPPPTPGPPTPGGPDLIIISSFTGTNFTVRNQGPTNAGPFRVRVSSSPTGDTNYDCTGLAAGTTETRR